MDGSFRTALCHTVLLVPFASTTASAQRPKPWVSETGTRHYFAVLVKDIDHPADWYGRAFGPTEHDRWITDDATARIMNPTNESLFVGLIWQAMARIPIRLTWTFC